MKVLIMNREEIETTSENLFSDVVGVISITDPNWTFATLKNKPKHLLQLVFDDIDNDVFEDDVHCIICQCEHGQSRSAAIAAAILEYETQDGTSVFADDKYYPNKVVFRKVYRALSK